MGFWHLPIRVIWAAALLVAAAFALLPSAASAHPGHGHAQTVATPDTTNPATARSTGKAVQILSAMPALPIAAHDRATCDIAGCCGNGPCTSHHGPMPISLPLALPPLSGSFVAAEDSAPPGDADEARLRRPPKSFA